ncbi:MAG: efflux RND transporter periplasmic adaptor subunit [candidate division Zixibacteria bacterium]|nr:efflux RND transporter periplasmic adaptor subunit [candidate division Zixibacteria bacterium]
MKRVLIFAIIFIVLLIVLISYLVQSRKVDTGKLTLSGIVEAKQSDLAFRIPGQINSIHYDEGDFIDSGTVVAELDKSELEAVVDQVIKNFEAVRAGIVQLEISRETMARNLAKIESLIPTGAATRTQYDDMFDQKRQVEAQLEAARKNLEAVKASVNLAKIRLAYTTLASTTSGTVLIRAFEPGEVVNAGMPVLTLADLDNMSITVYLPEKYLGKVKLGHDVKIMIDSHPDNTFSGKIKYISDKAEFTPKNIQTRAERVKQVFEIKVSSGSHGGILKPGLPCDVEVGLE